MIRLLPDTTPAFVVLHLDGAVIGYTPAGAMVVVYRDLDEAADDAPDADLIGVIPARLDAMAAK